jgi:hypothetical protein
MKSKTLLLGIMALAMVLGINSVSAFATCANNGYAYAYGCPSTYESQPVRVGGFFGQNSAFLIGLKPGVNAGPYMNYQTRNAIASSYYPSCGYSSPCPRVGGYFGNYYSNIVPGTFVYGSPSISNGAPNYYFHGPL